MVAPDADAIGHDLSRNVAIAQMPGNAGQLHDIGASEFSKLFRGCDNFNQPAVIEYKGIAILQNDGIRQVKHEFCASHTGHGNASTITPLVIENDGVGRLDLPGAFWTNETSFDHGTPIGAANWAVRFDMGFR